MIRLKQVFILAALIALGVGPAWAQDDSIFGPAQTDHVVAELVSELAAIRPGETFDVALRLRMDPHWHVYWTNPGDTGMAPTVEWELPEGFEIGPLRFPYPSLIPTPPYRSYGYEGEVLLLARVAAPETLEPGASIAIKAAADWLVCEDVCIPGSAKLGLNLPVLPPGGAPPTGPSADAFADARARLPVEPEDGRMGYELLADSIVATLQWEGFVGAELEEPYFFFEQEAATDSAAQPTFDLAGDTLRVAIPKSPYFDESVETFSGVLYSKSGFAAAGGANAIRFDTAKGAPAGIALEGAAALAPEPEIGFALALFYAFVGGLILNLMPCVFPVLSIKALGFVQQSGDARSKPLHHGLVFAAGVLISFWILAGALIALNAAGQNLGWGFQLQEPGFIVGLLVVMFLFGLSLSGVFEIGTSAISLAGKVKSGGYAGSFFSGILATAVATPCTAPFMGVALGVALAMPAAQSLTVFTFLGLGMALPYVVLSANPRLIKKLPRPGAWMETFKQAMAFPMFATCVWLIWVLGAHVGNDGLLKVLFGLVALAIGAWVYGRWTQPHRRALARRGAIATGVAFAALGIWLMLPRASAEIAETEETSDIAWQKFSPALVAQLQADDKPYFIDFTADWCLTCKANEARALSPSRVVDRIRESGVAMIKADWTKRDADITQALSSYGRSGVPLYIFDPGGPGARPEVLPQLLSPDLVLEKLAQAARAN